jgi:hypothetical protein
VLRASNAVSTAGSAWARAVERSRGLRRLGPLAQLVLLSQDMKKTPTSLQIPRAALHLEAVTGGMPSGRSSFRDSDSSRRGNVSFDTNPPKEHSYYTYMGKEDQAKYDSLKPAYQRAISSKSPSEQLAFLDRR